MQRNKYENENKIPQILQEDNQIFERLKHCVYKCEGNKKFKSQTISATEEDFSFRENSIDLISK